MSTEKYQIMEIIFNAPQWVVIFGLDGIDNCRLIIVALGGAGAFVALWLIGYRDALLKFNNFLVQEIEVEQLGRALGGRIRRVDLVDFFFFGTDFTDCTVFVFAFESGLPDCKGTSSFGGV